MGARAGHGFSCPFPALLYLVPLILLYSFLGCAPLQSTDTGPLSGDYEDDPFLGEHSYLSSSPELAPSEYRLGPDDVVNVLVYSEPDLTTMSRVSQDGFIELPLIGKVSASGLTREELGRKIETRFMEGYLVKPDVTIILQQYRQNRFGMGVQQLQQLE